MKLESNQVVPQTQQDVEFLNSYLNRDDIIIGKTYNVNFDCILSMIKLRIPIDDVPIGVYIS